MINILTLMRESIDRSLNQFDINHTIGIANAYNQFQINLIIESAL